jgi:hypothetical protein
VDLDLEGVEPVVTDDDGFWAFCLFDEGDRTVPAVMTVALPAGFRTVGPGIGPEDQDSDVEEDGSTSAFVVATELGSGEPQFEIVDEFAIRIGAGLVRPSGQIGGVDIGECDTEGNRSVRFVSRLVPADVDGVTAQWYSPTSKLVVVPWKNGPMM